MNAKQAVKYIENITVLLLVFVELSAVNGHGCRSLSINTFIEDKALTNHTVRTIQPITGEDECRRQCYMELLCFSFNFCHLQGNLPLCELTNSDHVRHEKDLKGQAGCTYYGSENSCSSSPCPSNATCQGDFLHDPVPYKCVCPVGFTGEKCEQDIDECTAGTHDCHVNATCNNTIGGFNCSCNTSFQGNGKDCQDINECTARTHNCHVNATCFNTIGGFHCSCKKDHYGNGTACCWASQGIQTIFDFENGKPGWTLTGTVFNNQPTYGDNPTARGRGQPSKHVGDWWIGGYENRPNPSSPAGGIQDDGPYGTMTSPEFYVFGPQLKFLIGGGCNVANQRAELVIGGAVVAKDTGECTETMATKYWDVSQYHGKKAKLRLVDEQASRGWNHINFDHLEGRVCIY